jgi:hypothetical protein
MTSAVSALRNSDDTRVITARSNHFFPIAVLRGKFPAAGSAGAKRKSLVHSKAVVEIWSPRPVFVEAATRRIARTSGLRNALWPRWRSPKGVMFP